MSGDLLVSRWTRPARRRGLMAVVAPTLPLALLGVVAAWRLASAGAALAVAAGGLGIVAMFALRRLRRYDRTWLVRSLDAAYAELEDSSALLFVDESALAPLARLQRARLLARMSDERADTLAPVLQLRGILVGWGFAAAAVAALLLWRSDAPPGLAPASEGLPALSGVPRLVGQRLRIVPPAYTGLPARDSTMLDARAPLGSRIEWRLGFAPTPIAAAIDLAAGGRMTLVREGAEWTAAHILDRAFLYRVVPSGAPARPVPPLHRIDATADSAPRVRLATPERTLNLVAPGQRRWSLRFVAEDDYGVSATARLRLILAIGEGENIRFSERTITLRGEGPARRRSFAASLDLAALGFAEAGDLIAQLTVSDTRTPLPQAVRSASVILRRPSASATGEGLEAITRRVMPAYFASERQIIIDTERLIAERARLDRSALLARSDRIGADQAALRMRYGQFMGQENEGGGSALPTADLPTADAPAAEPEHHDGDGHDHPPAKVGDAAGIVAEVGHTHDEPEAATLLDPETRKTLKQALDNMWQAEVNLRQGSPTAALPYERRALQFIKQVQQATRIFLARVGSRLPPVDETRRMTGKREGIASRDADLADVPATDPAVATAWRQLGGAGSVELAPLERWLAANRARAADPLALAAAIDGVRRNQRCAECRARLRALLWAVLPRPAALPARRAPPDATGRRYLQAIAR